MNMPVRPHPPESGFTLTELLFVLAISGLLLAVALPGYMDYRLRAGRADGKIKLLEVAASQERYFSENNQYSPSARPMIDPSSTDSILSDQERYLITVSATQLEGRYTGFTAAATPRKGQVNDRVCFTLTLSSTGEKGVISDAGIPGSRAVARDCWSR